MSISLGRWSRAFTWVVWVSLVSGMLQPSTQAQEFDFTPSGATPSDPTLAPPPVPSTSTLGSQSSPAGAVPVMPILPQAQPAGNLPTVPLPPSQIPAMPTSGSASAASTSYTRQPNITPGVPQTGNQPGTLSEGTTLPLTVYRDFTSQPYQAINSNLQVADPVTDDRGNVVIPAGSVVWGSFVPVVDQEEVETTRGETRIDENLLGNRFVANRLTVGPQTYLIQGSSEILPARFNPEADLGTVALRGAGYGALGGLALGVFTGGIGLIPIMAGSAAGAAAGTTTVDRVVTLEPNTIIPITLTENLIIR